MNGALLPLWVTHAWLCWQILKVGGCKAPVVVIKTPWYFGPCPIPPKGLLKSHRRVLVDEREAENHAFLYPSWARNMYGNAWARIMYGNAEFQIFLLFGRLVLEKLNEKAVPPLRGRQRGETVFLEAVPTWGLDAGLRRRASRRRAGPPGGTWEGDTLSGGLKPVLLSIRSDPRLLGGTTETVMERWRRDGRSQPVWVTAEGSFPFLLMRGLWLLLQKSASLRLPSRVTYSLHLPEEKGRDRSWSASTGSLSPAGLSQVYRRLAGVRRWWLRFL